MDNFILGIDPGGKGAAVILEAETGHIAEICRFDEYTEIEMCYFILTANILAATNTKVTDLHNVNITVYLERVHAMPKQGISSTAKFMRHYGIITGACYCAEYKIIEVTPQKWQKFFNVSGRGKPKYEHKQNLVQKAQELFGYQKQIINNSSNKKRKKNYWKDIADALLIAEYGRKQER